MLMFAAASQVAHAQTLELNIPFPHGGPGTILSRLAVDHIKERTGLDYTIVARPGAEGKIGTRFAATQPPSANLLLVTASTMVINRALDRQYEFNHNEWEIVAPIVSFGMNIVVTSKSTIKDWKDFQHQAKTRPVVCSYATTAARSALLYIKNALDLRQLELVYYKALAEQATNLMGGSLECAAESFILPIWTSPEHRDRYRLIASMTDSAPPGVPLVKDTVPNLVAGSWFGFAMRRDAPEKERKAVMDALRDMHTSPRVIQGIAAVPAFILSPPARPSGNALVDRELQFWSTFVNRNPKLFQE